MTSDKKTMEHYAPREEPLWCLGCGDAGVLAAFKRTCVDMDLDPSQLVVVTGIGCSSKISEYIKCYGFHWLHGRLLPVAMAIHAANPNLTVVGMGGDGDGYAIGMEHFIHACRRNPDITYIVMNNMVYGLTKGQASPTTHLGLVTTTTPFGAKERPVDGVELAISAGATFVARSFAYNQKELVELMKLGIEHKGFSFIEVLSPCPTYHREPAYEHVRDWFRDNMKDVIAAWKETQQIGIPATAVIEDFDPHDIRKSLEAVLKAKEDGKLVTGLIFVKDGIPTFEENHEIDAAHTPVGINVSVEANRTAYEKLLTAFT